MMFRGKIAAVSYLNTVPFIYGIEHAEPNLCADLLLAPPSRCAEAFNSGSADLALVPIGSLPMLDGAKIITSYCIGSVNPVRTVTLMSNSPISQIRKIYLDSHSMTSALLVKILCERLWGVDPQWEELCDYSVVDSPEEGDAFLLIGDKVFDYEGRFEVTLDLAECWRELTGMPFVFAVWVAREGVEQKVVERLEASLEWGTRHIAEAIDYYGHSGKQYAYRYLTENIDFVFDIEKQKALHKFWDYGRKFFPRVNPG